ncbi:MAG: helix-turn-helix transcriptional regulator [Deltaproteobacteria bacterium]|nr:helix-turn-helix transcriptional regulator [Deltaproteobacteria bacterium]
MGRMKKLSVEERGAARRALYAAIDEGGLPLGEAVRRMREITGLTQQEFAERIAGVSPRALAAVERGEGNPTKQTLEAIGAPFGLTLAYVRKPHE